MFVPSDTLAVKLPLLVNLTLPLLLTKLVSSTVTSGSLSFLYEQSNASSLHPSGYSTSTVVSDPDGLFNVDKFSVNVGRYCFSKGVSKSDDEAWLLDWLKSKFTVALTVLSSPVGDVCPA